MAKHRKYGRVRPVRDALDHLHQELHEDDKEFRAMMAEYDGSSDYDIYLGSIKTEENEKRAAAREMRDLWDEYAYDDDDVIRLNQGSDYDDDESIRRDLREAALREHAGTSEMPSIHCSDDALPPLFE